MVVLASSPFHEARGTAERVGAHWLVHPADRWLEQALVGLGAVRAPLAMVCDATDVIQFGTLRALASAMLRDPTRMSGQGVAVEGSRAAEPVPQRATLTPPRPEESIAQRVFRFLLDPASDLSRGVFRTEALSLAVAQCQASHLADAGMPWVRLAISVVALMMGKSHSLSQMLVGARSQDAQAFALDDWLEPGFAAKFGGFCDAVLTHFPSSDERITAKMRELMQQAFAARISRLASMDKIRLRYAAAGGALGGLDGMPTLHPDRG